MQRSVKNTMPLVFVLLVGIGISACKKNVFIAHPSSNPEAIFNEVWNVMDQRYSFFVLKNVDWKAQYGYIEVRPIWDFSAG